MLPWKWPTGCPSRKWDSVVESLCGTVLLRKSGASLICHISQCKYRNIMFSVLWLVSFSVTRMSRVTTRFSYRDMRAISALSCGLWAATLVVDLRSTPRIVNLPRQSAPHDAPNLTFASPQLNLVFNAGRRVSKLFFSCYVASKRAVCSQPVSHACPWWFGDYHLSCI